MDDQDDRNALYSIRSNICASALYSGNTKFREMIIEDVRRLVEKFPGGYEEWEEMQGSQDGKVSEESREISG